MQTEKQKESYSKYYYSTLEKQHERSRRYYQEHRAEKSAQRKEYRKTHPSKPRQLTEEQKEAKKFRNWLRRALIHSTVFDLTKDDTDKIKGSGCLACGTKERPSLAHNIPVKYGGHTTKDNCFCLCVSCNAKMGTKTLSEWRPDLVEKLAKIMTHHPKDMTAE